MSVFATYNLKGGVGKTAAAVNLAWLSAQEGARTLVWDLDPQGAASFYFRIESKVKGGGRGLVQGKRDARKVIKGTDFPNLDLLPADFSYRNMDLALDSTKKPVRRLWKLLKPLSREYDNVFLDCPPSISLVSESVFHATDALLVPMIPTTLSVRTWHQLLAFMERSRITRPRLLPFLAMVDRRKKLHVEVIAHLLKTSPQILQSYIPAASEVERMGVARAPLGEFAGRSPSMAAYRALWREIQERLVSPQAKLSTIPAGLR